MEEVFDKTSGLVFIFVQDEVLVSWAFSFLSFFGSWTSYQLSNFTFFIMKSIIAGVETPVVIAWVSVPAETSKIGPLYVLKGSPTSLYPF